VDRDLAKFFDRVNHHALRARVARQVRDKAGRGLLGKSRRAGGLVGESLQPTDDGGPHGAPLSPLVSTVRGDDGEKELERRGHHFARYGEDFRLGVHRRRARARVKPRLTRVLRHHRKLELTETKRTGGPPNDGRFLGCPFHGPRSYWAPEARQEFRHRLRPLTGRSWGGSRASRLSQLND
jgi:RNA-directed DNA polymerase